MAKIKNIIFDLGGVLLNIDYNKTIEAFNALGYPKFENEFSQYNASAFFEEMEIGKISEKEFLEKVALLIKFPVSKEQIINAWNAMLLDFRTESLGFLEELSASYNLYLLSNTNSIHLKKFQKIFTVDTGKPLLDAYFNKTWYSHIIGLRKPYKEIYEFVLREENMQAEETFFIDDTKNNIDAANELGIKTHLLLPRERIEMLSF